MDKGIKVLMVLPAALIAASVMIAVRMDPAPVLTPEEFQILGAYPREIGLPERPDVRIKNPLRSPLGLPASPPASVAGEPADDGAVATAEKAKGLRLNVSLIVLGGKRRVALISGNVVGEGDRINGMTVKRIERDRVVLNDMELYLDRIK